MKRFVLIAIVIFFAVVARAQGRRNIGQSYYLGAMDGVTASQDVGDGYAGYKQYGFTMGVYARKFLKPKYSLELELIYKEKGANYNLPSQPNPNPQNLYYTSPTYGYFLKLNYIELPLLLQYNFLKGTMRGVILQVGPSYGLLVHQSEIVSTPGFNTFQAPNFNATELAYNLGVRYVFPSNFGWDLRFSRSITPVRDATNSAGQDVKNFNAVVSLALTYQFGF